MVARFRVVTAALALTVTPAAIGCGALIGIEDGVADPGTSAADATTLDSATTVETGATDASTDAAMMADVVATPGPMGKPGGDTTSLPCGGASCAIPGESCCSYRAASMPGVYNGVCATTCAPPGGGTDRLGVLKCSGPSNCLPAAPRCCYSLVTASTIKTTCQTSCDFQTEVQLCDPGGPDTCGTKSCGHFSGMTMPPSWGYCN